MEVKRESLIDEIGADAIYVSILVLMEVKREHPCASAWAITSPGFNPCFDGSEAREDPFRDRRIHRLSFNPCFDGSEARGWRNGLWVGTDRAFQSLF